MSFITDLQPLASATVVASKGTTDEFGRFTSASTTNLTECRIEGEAKRVLNSQGAEVISMHQVISLGDNGLFAGKDSSTKEEWRFTLPTDDYPDVTADKEAIAIERYTDETGAIVAEEIQL